MAESAFSGKEEKEKKTFSEKGTRRRKSEVSTRRSQAATSTLFLGQTNQEATVTCCAKFVNGRRRRVRVLSRDHLCESHLCWSIV